MRKTTRDAKASIIAGLVTLLAFSPVNAEALFCEGTSNIQTYKGISHTTRLPMVISGKHEKLTEFWDHQTGIGINNEGKLFHIFWGNVRNMNVTKGGNILYINENGNNGYNGYFDVKKAHGVITSIYIDRYDITSITTHIFDCGADN